MPVLRLCIEQREKPAEVERSEGELDVRLVGDSIMAGAQHDAVSSLTSIELIVAVIARDRVDVGSAFQRVVATVQEIVAVTTGQEVIAIATRDRVVAKSAAQCVVAIVTAQ